VEKRAKFSLWYFLFLLVGIFLLECLFFAHPEGKAISYSRFLELVTSDSVKSVVIETNQIYGLLKVSQDSMKIAKTTAGSADSLKQASQHQTASSAKDSSAALAAKAKKEETPQHSFTPWRLLPGNEKEKYDQLVKKQFTVVRLDDPNLLELLQAHHVTIRGKIESGFRKNLFYNWIIPFEYFFFCGSSSSAGWEKARIF